MLSLTNDTFYLYITCNLIKYSVTVAYKKNNIYNIDNFNMMIIDAYDLITQKFLNSLTTLSISIYKFKLKIRTLIGLLRNLYQVRNPCNENRLVVIRFWKKFSKIYFMLIPNMHLSNYVYLLIHFTSCKNFFYILSIRLNYI